MSDSISYAIGLAIQCGYVLEIDADGTYRVIRPDGSTAIVARRAESTKAVIEILRLAYSAVPEDRKGKTRCVDFDPSGSTFEFTEHQWSVDARKLLGIELEPTGI